METTLFIPEPISKAADEIAAELQVSRDELYLMAIEQFLKTHQRSAITQALDEIYETESSELDPVILQMQIASIPAKPW